MRYEILSRQLIRALRGARSQQQLCRRLGLRSNPVYRWEAGRAQPSAQQLFQIARVTRAVSKEGLAQFLGGRLPSQSLETKTGVCELMQTLCSSFGILELARKLGVSRFVVSRWLSGKSDVRLPDLLHVVDATSLKLLDFLSLFVDPARLDAVASRWKRLRVARATAHEAPWSHAVLRVLELADYADERAPKPGWIAARLGISLDEERRCLDLLLRGGQIRRVRNHYRVRDIQVVDTGVDPTRRRELRTFWSNVAIQRLAAGVGGLHSYNLFAVSRRDLEALRALQVEYFERMRTLIDASEPSECVVIYSAQLLSLDAASG